MLARAAQKQIPTAHLLAGRGEELPFPAGSFDSAVAVTALLAVESPAAVLAQMRRVLRPGGTLLLGVLNRRGPLNRRRARSGGGTFDEARFLTREELEELLEGMDEVRIRATTFVPDHPFFFRLGLLLEPLGRLLGWRWGELLVATARAR
jgi:SAM-dependent methyltransferase